MRKKILAAGMIFALGISMTACAGTDTSGTEEEIAVSVAQDDEKVDEAETETIPETESGSSDSGSDSTQPAADNPSTMLITEDDAVEIAIEDSGLSKDALTGTRVKSGTEHGNSVYEVELYADAEEYEYELDAATGEILDKDYDYDEAYSSAVTVPSGVIARDEAVALVLERVDGATEWDLRIKLDKDDGQYVWEGDLYYDAEEYEFEISGSSGTFLEWER